MSLSPSGIWLENVTPRVRGSRHPVKSTLGDLIHVEADVLREGHDPISATLLWRQLSPRAQRTDWERVQMGPLGNDRWSASFTPGRLGLFEFSFEAHALGAEERSTRFEETFRVIVDRTLARAGAWYELFPRSYGKRGEHGTLRDVEALFPRLASLGFDVLYLPPVHPIGRTGRKGKDNTLPAAPHDVGSPWAIGAREGGHKAIHPELGTLEDFRRMCANALEHGLELAMDLAFQCSPDHPYVREHPEWFLRKPDGTLKTAENPPKKYEDIANFAWLGPAREALWAELLSVVLFWIEQGVKAFRVDNPHTKPLSFWSWLLDEVRERHPDVLFLAEAFTRPKLVRALAKVGFHQSYTYFTWRTSKRELQDYLRELTQSEVSQYMRGNLWPNTPDILPEILQRGGASAFKLRLVLAATLSSSYGIYSGYELCEGLALPDSEEYRGSEKYELARRDFTQPSIQDFVASINRIRRAHPALRLYNNLRFHEADNELVIFYGKKTPGGLDPLLIAVSLDPFHPQSATLRIPRGELGLHGSNACEVRELLTGQEALWAGDTVRIHLTPESPCAIWSVRLPRRDEHAFDYY